jgi:hypothetical protein
MRLLEIFEAEVSKILTVEPALDCDEGEIAYLDVRVASEEGNPDPEAGDCIYLNREQVTDLRDYLTELLG